MSFPLRWFHMPELSVVVPAFNERSNVQPMVDALAHVLKGIDYEVIFVDDDSPDGTADLVRTIAQTDSRVRVIQRIRRKGLASAVVEGMMASSAAYQAVIDGDMQHDESILPQMLARIKEQQLDLVIGSRNIEGGSMGEFAKERVALSGMGKRLSKLVSKEDISDPMSGFFMVDRRFLNEVVRGMSMTGFKVLMDLVASSRRPVRFSEVGYTFRNRLSGESKLDIVVGLEYLKLVADKMLGDWVPVNFIVFSAVGAVGVTIYLALVFLQIRLLQFDFGLAQTVASSIVIAINFWLNNILTFRSMRLRGARALTGLVVFYTACSVGLLANVWVAKTLRSSGVDWVPAGLVGITIGSAWNYWMTSVFVWGVNRRRVAAKLGQQ
jgi:dolichol-phosphate mannosyltransferase